jgi:toxin ParE1/3/4
VNPRFSILPRAAADLREQRDYIAQDNFASAERFLAAAEEAFERLATMPGMGVVRTVRNPRLGRIRQWPIRGFERHLIFYRETEAGIEVVRVLHGARDSGRILERETG